MRERLILLVLLCGLIGISYLSETMDHGGRVWFAIGGGLGAFFFYLFASTWRYRTRQTPHAPHFRPFVSMVIAAKNEDAVIRATVVEMMKVVYHNSDGTPNYELIVVDDGSDDRTLEVLQALAPDYPNLVVHHRAPRPKSSKSAAINEIEAIAKGEIMAIFDADARVKPDYLERIIPFLADPRVGGAQAHKTVSNPDVNWLTLAQADELLLMGHIEEGRDLGNGAVEMRGNGMVVRRAAVADVGGWNDKALTEDLDMSTRMMLNRWEVRFCPNVPVYEEAVTTWNALFKQRRRWAEGSLRRYLHFFFDFLGPHVPLSKKADFMAFMTEFCFPIWLVVDVAIHVMNLVNGVPLHVSAYMYFMGLLFIITSVSVANGIRQKVTRDWRQIVKRTLLQEIYLLHWIPVMLWTFAHILISPKPMEWVKTDHTGTHHDVELV